MKRRTRLIVIGCATLGGTFFTTAATQVANAATPNQITVQAGDTLSGIGAATGQSWVALAAYNQIPDPNLIFVGQVINIPPAGYVAPASAPASSDTTTVSQVSSDPAPAPAPDPAPAAAPASSSPSGIWACIAAHESGGDPSADTGNGFYGMYQDTQQSWVAAGGLAYAPTANLASAAAQTAVNQTIQAQQGWGAWPVSSVACGA